MAYSGPTIGNVNYNQAGSGSDLTISWPSASVGDLYIACVMDDSVNNATEFSSSDMTEIADVGSGTTDAHIAWYYRVVTGTESGSATFVTANGTNSQGWLMQIVGADTTDPIDGTYFGYVITAGSTTLASAAGTTSNDNELCLIGWAWDGGNGYPFSNSGTGWPTSPDYEAKTTTFGVCGGLVSKGVETAGTTEAMTTTASYSENGVQVGIMINPAPAGGSAGPFHHHYQVNLQ